jgi:hypothetical protein
MVGGKSGHLIATLQQDFSRLGMTINSLIRTRQLLVRTTDW